MTFLFIFLQVEFVLVVSPMHALLFHERTKVLLLPRQTYIIITSSCMNKATICCILVSHQELSLTCTEREIQDGQRSGSQKSMHVKVQNEPLC